MAAPLDIAPFLSPGRVVRLPGPIVRHQVISALADLAVADLVAHDRIAFLRAVLEREDVTTTAIGGGVALPHARSPVLPGCRLAVAICPEGVDWQAVDGRPVRVAVLLAAREADHAEHLRALAALAVRLRRPGLVEALAGAEPAAVPGLLAGAG